MALDLHEINTGLNISTRIVRNRLEEVFGSSIDYETLQFSYCRTYTEEYLERLCAVAPELLHKYLLHEGIEFFRNLPSIVVTHVFLTTHQLTGSHATSRHYTLQAVGTSVPHKPDNLYSDLELKIPSTVFKIKTTISQRQQAPSAHHQLPTSHGCVSF